jgi:bacterioferritin-associated ferredoxin
MVAGGVGDNCGFCVRARDGRYWHGVTLTFFAYGCDCSECAADIRNADRDG